MHFTAALVSVIAALGAVSAAPVESDQGLACRNRHHHRTPITHVVEVGKDGLTYTPPFITAEIGDRVELDFFAKNHTLVQSSFEDPCTPLHKGIFAGFQPTNVTAGTGLVILKTVKFDVDTTEPLFFYCAQANHCQKGMLFAINPPEGSFDTFQKVAATKEKNIAPPGGPHGVRAGLVERFV